MEEKPQSKSNQKWIIILLLLLIVAMGAVLAVVLGRSGNTTSNADDGKIKYSSEASVMLDQKSLQAAMDVAMENAAEGNIALLYKNNAYSEDGTNFECYIVNSASNAYDMFLTIFADSALTDQIYVSGLVPPGSGFENITLDHALEPGDHTVFVSLTQVKEDEESGEQVIAKQVMHTMEFHVAEE